MGLCLLAPLGALKAANESAPAPDPSPETQPTETQPAGSTPQVPEEVTLQKANWGLEIRSDPLQTPDNLASSLMELFARAAGPPNPMDHKDWDLKSPSERQAPKATTAKNTPWTCSPRPLKKPPDDS